jgi:magnesium transporter
MTPNPQHLAQPVLSVAHTGFTVLRQDSTAEQALVDIRNSGITSGIIYFYVVDAAGRLIGVLPTKRLLTCPPDTLLSGIMLSHVIAIPDTATVLDACEMFVLYKYLAFPVVDAQRRVRGIVEAGLLTDELALAGEETDVRSRYDAVFEAIGLHLSQMREATPWQALRFRFPWLLATLGSGTVAALLGKLYEATLARSLILVFFLSLVTGLGESVSMQSVTLTIQGLLQGRPGKGWYFRMLRRELATAALLGLACGGIVAGLVEIWRGPGLAPLAVGGSIFLSLCSACLMGLSIPSLLHALKLDPKIAAGPVTLAVTDIFTLTFYYNVGRWLLG